MVEDLSKSLRLEQGGTGPVGRRLLAALQLALTLVFLWFWVALAAAPTLHGPALEGLRMGPGWRLLYLGLALSTAISLVAPVLALIEPAWHRLRWIVSLFSSGAFIAFAAASMWTRGWVVPAASALEASVHDVSLSRGIDRGFLLGLGAAIFLTGLVTAVEVVRGAWRELRRDGT